MKLSWVWKSNWRKILRVFSFTAIFVSFGTKDCIASPLERHGAGLKEGTYYAEAFLNTLGICVHHAQGQSSQSYIGPLRYLKIRNIRDDLGTPQGYVHMRKQAGVKANLIVDSRPLAETIDILRYIEREDALLSIEGQNEPNNNLITYQGTKGGGFSRSPINKPDWTAVANLQKDLYAAVKSDERLAKYPVFNTSEVGAQSPNVGLQFLTIPIDSLALFPVGTKFADYANAHNYVIGTKKQHVANQAWNAADPTLNGAWDGLYGNYGKLWGHGYFGYTVGELLTLPRVTTETGWDSKTDPGGEPLQGKMLLNTYFSQFKRGWAYTFIYMLRDGEGGAGNQGVFNYDYSPKLAAKWIHNLTTILGDSGYKGKIVDLEVKMIGASELIHDLKLQKQANEYFYVIWGERVEGSEEITIEFDRRAARIEIFDPTVSEDPITSQESINNIKVKVADHPIIISVFFEKH